MSKPEVLSIASVVGLITPKAVYLLGYSWLFGMSLWVSFFAGVIAYKALPRQQFGTLQHRIFPVYFACSIGLSAILLGLWTYGHPDVVPNIAAPWLADVAQAYVVAGILIAQAGNQFIVGPMTSKTMFKRYQQEKDEGKSYNEPGVSDKMKALNSTFAQLHGISSLANLYAVIALVFHGMWIANNGLGEI